MITSISQISELDIIQLEKYMGFILPTSYRTFLLKYNGGRPDEEYFVIIPGWQRKKTVINDFNGLMPGRPIDLTENIRWLKGQIPNGFIPIAEDPGGNYFLISLVGETLGRVYFWDHEGGVGEHTEDVLNYPNIYFLANDFDEFLSNLKNKEELE